MVINFFKRHKTSLVVCLALVATIAFANGAARYPLDQVIEGIVFYTFVGWIAWIWIFTSIKAALRILAAILGLLTGLLWPRQQWTPQQRYGIPPSYDVEGTSQEIEPKRLSNRQQ
jgi:TM2 domain-containing membrane protein YozV